MSSPRTSKLTGTVLWSDGSNFNGFAVVGLIVPTSSGVAWPELTIEPNDLKQRLPLWSTIPIKDATFNQQVGLWLNSDITPPNTKYAIWYYDTGGKLVCAPSSSADFFFVTADPTTPTSCTLTVPVLSTTIPDPDESPESEVITVTTLFIGPETPSGVIDSTTGSDGNGVFTVSVTPAAGSLQLFRNGIFQLLNTDYTLSGNTITYTTGFKPVVGDWHVAYYRQG